MAFDKTAYQREYMRRRRAKTAPPPPPDQANAHLKAYVAQLDDMARLDFKSFVRRSLAGRGHLWRPLASA